MRFHECVGSWFDYLLVSPREMSDILDATGWKVERVIQDEGPAYLAVVRKLW